MAHRRKPRRNKTTEMLVTTDNVVRMPLSAFKDRENQVPRMTEQQLSEARAIIQHRFDTARDETDRIAAKMANWEKQYNGQWQDSTIDDERIYLPKTREQLQVVRAYILLLVSQLDPIVTMNPMVSSIWASKQEYRNAKVAEALTDFHFDDLWKIRDDVFPRWLNTFLKFSMAVWKVTYREDDFLPDLNIDVIDRALLYIDPNARDIKTARWVIERYFLPRSEVMERIEEGHWHLNEDFNETIESGFHAIPDEIRQRYYGDNYGDKFSVPEDDLIEVWDYWQAPIKGLQDVYAVILGGEGGHLVRHGRNPFPYKGLPYRAKSFDPHEYRPDGMGLVEQFRPIQEVVNNFLNMRITDVRKNIVKPVAATGRFIDAQTQEDFRDGKKIVRLTDEVMEAAKDPGFDLRKHFFELPFNTSTGELLVNDLPFILGQGKETGHVGDVFKGMSPPHQATLGQIQEQLSRNQGVFRPIYLQVMRGFEELAEICMAYFKDPEFFPTDRIIQITGKNKYSDVIADWHNPGGDLFVRSVSPDEMDVDVTIDAVSSADALASRTFLMTSLEQIFQSIGQIPELFQVLKEELNFTNIAEMMLHIPGVDIESIRYTPQQKEEKKKEEQAQKQQGLQMQQVLGQMQAQITAMEEQGKQNARAQATIAIDSNKARLDATAEGERLMLDNATAIEQIVTKIRAQLQADLVAMTREATLERQNADLSVGHGNDISH